MSVDFSLKTRSPLSTKQTEETVTSQFLFELTLFSTSIFVFSALLLRFLLNLQTFLLLRIYSIHFQYSLLNIRFSSEDGTKWPFARILLVFGLGFLVFSFAALLLVKKLRKIHKGNWKFRLFLTWIAFLFAHTLPAGIIAGVLFYNSFGIAFHWLISNMIFRSLIAAGVLVLMILFRPLWLFLFLNASPRRIFVKNNKYQNVYIQAVFFKSWLLGFLILLVFSLLVPDGFWPVYIFSLGFIAVPLFNKRGVHKKFHISRSEKKIISSRYAVLFVLVFLLILWVENTFKFTF